MSISVKGYYITLILHVQMKDTTCINEIVAHTFTTQLSLSNRTCWEDNSNLRWPVVEKRWGNFYLQPPPVLMWLPYCGSYVQDCVTEVFVVVCGSGWLSVLLIHTQLIFNRALKMQCSTWVNMRYLQMCFINKGTWLEDRYDTVALITYFIYCRIFQHYTGRLWKDLSVDCFWCDIQIKFCNYFRFDDPLIQWRLLQSSVLNALLKQSNLKRLHQQLQRCLCLSVLGNSINSTGFRAQDTYQLYFSSEVIFVCCHSYSFSDLFTETSLKFPLTVQLPKSRWEKRGVD